MVGSRFFEAAALFPDKTELRAGEWALAGKLLERSAVPLLEETNEKGKRIIAFAVIDSEFAVLHYAFVAESERRKGHLKRLIAPLLEETWSYTRVTPTGRAVGTKLGGKFQPYRLYDILGG